MIRAVIIDDEKDARFLLRNLLEEHYGNEVEVVAEANDVQPGYQAIKKHRPELVFLDIKMPKGTGFDLLDQFEEIDFEVIFITAYDKYAVKAFRFSAFGYLLKPIRTKELKEVIASLRDHISRLKTGMEKRLKVLVENYGDDRKIKKLVISNVDGFKVSDIEDIIRLEGDGNYTHFIMLNGQKVTTSKSLGEYEKLLNSHGFFRIHQSTIVNLRHVEGYVKGTGGMVEMCDGKSFKVSRHRKPGFLKRFY